MCIKLFILMSPLISSHNFLKNNLTFLYLLMNILLVYKIKSINFLYIKL